MSTLHIPIPGQDDINVPVPEAPKEGIDRFFSVVTGAMDSQYFWGAVVLLILISGTMYVWNHYKSVRYAAMVILGMAIGNFFPVVDIFQ
jgi:hypothetical protein